MTIPVITLDGPSASGKGTVAARVAASLGFIIWIQGALYRLMALYAMRNQIALDHEARLAMAAVRLPPPLPRAWSSWRARMSATPSAPKKWHRRVKVAVLPALRAALLQRQRDFRQAPGLVTDGRDMGSVVSRRHGEGVPHRQRRRTRAPPP